MHAANNVVGGKVFTLAEFQEGGRDSWFGDDNLGHVFDAHPEFDCIRMDLFSTQELYLNTVSGIYEAWTTFKGFVVNVVALVRIGWLFDVQVRTITLS